MWHVQKCLLTSVCQNLSPTGLSDATFTPVICSSHQRGYELQPEQKVRKKRHVTLCIPLKIWHIFSKLCGGISVIWPKYFHFCSVWNNRILFPNPSLNMASSIQGARLITSYQSWTPLMELHNIQLRKLQRHCDPLVWFYISAIHSYFEQKKHTISIAF